MQPYHLPVLLNESVEALQIKADGNYADLTFGGGGHTRKMAEKLTVGKIYAFDQDTDASENMAGLEDKVIFIQANFRYLKKYMKVYKAPLLDGILADLGISSHQIDAPERGFSTRFEGELDMRMNKEVNFSAFDLINTYKEDQLAKIFYQYGDLSNSRMIGKLIVGARIKGVIRTTTDLKQAVLPLAPKGKEFKFFAQVFQAIRIEVNAELQALEEMLLQSTEVMKPGGIFAVLTYHSLEDRLVKNFFQKGKFSGEEEKDVYGNSNRPFSPSSNKIILPSEEEILLNNRARSAKLRVAIKN